VQLGDARIAVDLGLPLARLSRLCERAGIPLIRPKRTYERFADDWHTTATANENMAGDVVDYLLAASETRGLLGRAARPASASSGP
jgi:hypothetical protein